MVTGRDATVLLDSAVGVDPPPADLLLLSHYHEDHTVDAATRARRVAIHHRDAPALHSWGGFLEHYGLPRGEWETDLVEQFGWAPLPAVDTFDDTEVYDLGGGVAIRVVPLPGHTAGHCGFLVEPDGVFYIADVELSSFGPVYGDRDSSLADVRSTLAAVADVDAAVVVPYHAKGPYFDRDEFLAALRRHAAALDAREERLLALLAERPRSRDEVVGEGVIYRVQTAPWFADEVERAMTGRHLDELVARAVVAGPDDDGRYRLR
ncbi:MBL fold metallo-hydrolase [Gordonia crocea]|uniref:Metallo-beta-lactamase domain-containing protein n=1 Tax=Gordonia crocea TaxID=589162 RepID=A0A7I9V0B9_9ACTN|nr:MBL fold metallo-hydrolase [Gordonia crocea]GED98815.1 hypothetical protein nbrc107697_28540 [Gordonia crocea]